MSTRKSALVATVYLTLAVLGTMTFFPAIFTSGVSASTLLLVPALIFHLAILRGLERLLLLTVVRGIERRTGVEYRIASSLVADRAVLVCRQASDA